MCTKGGGGRLSPVSAINVVTTPSHGVTDGSERARAAVPSRAGRAVMGVSWASHRPHRQVVAREHTEESDPEDVLWCRFPGASMAWPLSATSNIRHPYESLGPSLAGNPTCFGFLKDLVRANHTIGHKGQNH